MLDLIFTVCAIFLSFITIILAIFLPKNPGIQGVTGFTGPTGPPGSTVGDTGPTGFMGATGATGSPSILISKAVEMFPDSSNTYTIKNTVDNTITGTNFYITTNDGLHVYIDANDVYLGDIFSLSNYGSGNIVIYPTSFLNVSNKTQSYYVLPGLHGTAYKEQTRTGLIMITMGDKNQVGTEKVNSLNFNLLYSLVRTSKLKT